MAIQKGNVPPDKDGKVWAHPVFGSVKTSLRRSRNAKQAHEEFLKNREYVSPSGLFAQYHFLRCIHDGIPVKIETFYIEGQMFTKVSI